jgi:ABC-type branched-subunit amino acid transport system substrate-binding protein
MLDSLLARGRALSACACSAVAVAVAGCTTTTAASSSVTGGTLTIYVSVPPGTLSPEAQDVLSAEQLAFQQAGTHAGSYTVKLKTVRRFELSENARTAISDSSTIAYLGEIAPGTSEGTIGITNAQDILQVSPTDTAVEETQQSAAVPNSPTRYYESLSSNGRTFARVVPSDALEAKALIAQMQALGIGALYVANDGSAYGKAIAAAVGQVARGASIKLTVGPPDAKSFLSSGADAIFLGASSANASSAASLFGTIANTSTAKLFAPSALAQSAFVSALSPAAQRGLYVSSPGFTSADLPAQGQQFVSAFKAAYQHAPGTEAIFGYEAMAAVMYVLQHQAGSSAGNRGTVVHDFFALRNRSSAIGTYSINPNGNISFAAGAPFVISKVKGGKLVPARAFQEQG